MPYNGVGVFQRLYNWTIDQANGILVRNDRMDADTQDIADGLSNCITRDGQSIISANIPMSTFKLTGLGTGAAPTDSVNFGQVFVAPSFTGGITYAGGLTGTGGATLSGALSFAGATTVTVPTVAPGDNSTKAASTAFATALAFNAALPAQSLGFLRSSGTVTGFTQTHTGYAQNEVKGADVASAGTINLTTATGNFVHLTGTSTVTAITIPIGAKRTVVADGALILTHSSALLLPGAANITTAANDRFDVVGDTAGAVVTSYARADGTPIKGGVTLLATLTPTAAANLDFLTTFTAAFDNYLIQGNGITVNVSDTLAVRCANAGVVDSGSNYYVGAGYSTAVVTITATNVQLNPQLLAGGKGMNFDIRIKNASDATRLKTITIEAVNQTNATPGYGNDFSQSTYAAANAISGFRLFFTGGSNFGATGKVRVYGYNNS